MKRAKWFDRRFAFDLPLSMAPNVVERLRGTPARLEERVRGVPPAVLGRRAGKSWSIQENAGHLWDLETLWLARVEDLEAGSERLAPADLENRRTHEAGHNERPLAEILAGFRGARGRLVGRLEGLSGAMWGRSALHPRLGVPMRMVDLAEFVAEHDDHHLARISELLRG